MARFADGEAWPVRRTGDKTAGSAPAQSSINNSAAVETQGEKSGPQKAVLGSGEGTPGPWNTIGDGTFHLHGLHGTAKTQAAGASVARAMVGVPFPSALPPLTPGCDALGGPFKFHILRFVCRTTRTGGGRCATTWSS